MFRKFFWVFSLFGLIFLFGCFGGGQSHQVVEKTINVSQIPSLKGVWKCDFDGGSITIQNTQNGLRFKLEKEGNYIYADEYSVYLWKEGFTQGAKGDKPMDNMEIITKSIGNINLRCKKGSVRDLQLPDSVSFSQADLRNAWSGSKYGSDGSGNLVGGSGDSGRGGSSEGGLGKIDVNAMEPFNKKAGEKAAKSLEEKIKIIEDLPIPESQKRAMIENLKKIKEQAVDEKMWGEVEKAKQKIKEIGGVDIGGYLDEVMGDSFGGLDIGKEDAFNEEMNKKMEQMGEKMKEEMEKNITDKFVNGMNGGAVDLPTNLPEGATGGVDVNSGFANPGFDVN